MSEPASALQASVEWLTAEQQEAWLAVVRLMTWLPWSVDQQLRRDPGVALGDQHIAPRRAGHRAQPRRLIRERFETRLLASGQGRGGQGKAGRSEHADAAEIGRWLSAFSRAPAMTYLVHGEPVALEALRAHIQAERGWPVHIAKYLERVELVL